MSSRGAHTRAPALDAAPGALAPLRAAPRPPTRALRPPTRAPRAPWRMPPRRAHANSQEANENRAPTAKARKKPAVSASSWTLDQANMTHLGAATPLSCVDDAPHAGRTATRPRLRREGGAWDLSSRLRG